MTLLAELRRRDLVPALLARLKSNDCHNPAGSGDGGQFCGDGNGGSSDDHPSFASIHPTTNYTSGAERGAAPAPDKQASTWTPQSGGTLLHGSSSAFNRFDSAVAYMTDDFKEAEGYARGAHYGGGRGRWPMVMRWEAKAGLTMNVNAYVADAIANDHDPDLALKAAYEYARSQGARYVHYDHPSNVYESKEQRVIVSLYPKEDLKFERLWRRDKKTMTKAPLASRDLPALQRLAERLEPSLRRAFLNAVRQLQNSIDLEKLAAAINANQLTAAEAAAKISTFPEVYGGLAAELRAGFLVGSGLAIRGLADQGISLSFNLVNPKAVDYASRATLDLVQPFQQNAKETIRTFLAKAASGETTASGAAKDIKDLIGLDPGRVKRADSFWQRLMEAGKDDQTIERRVGRYMDSLLRERAEVIARNEIHKAAGAGQQAAWDNAAETGLIDKSEYSKVWITTWDEVLCDLCEPMDGQAVGVDEAFDTPNGPQDFPDMHVQCRCTANLVKSDDVERYVDSLDRPEEKPQSRQ